MTSHLEVEVKEKVLEIKINKPKVNAIDLKLSQDLGKAFAELRDKPDLRVGIITGEGDKIFSAGWDLKAVNSGEMALDNWWEKADYGTAVAAAPYWHPIKLAGEAAFTDLITEGRLEFGIGSGAYQREFDRMHPGLKQSDAWKYMQESLPVIKKLWEGDYEHNGEFWSFPLSTSVPKPVQKGGPPVWVAARAPITYDYAVKNHCNIMSWPLTRPFSEAELYKQPH